MKCKPTAPCFHAIAAAALATVQLSALAQTTPAGELQTVTVTADRRVENIRDVPSSVSSLQGEILEVLNSGGQDIRLLAGRVPSLNIESSFGRAFPRFYIRGIGNTDFDLNASQPVSLVYDDVVQENPILKGFPIFDMATIEVLNGPQGTLFGRNSPAGVVKFESARPGKRLEGYGTLSVGRYKAVNVEGMVNVPMSETLALRVAAQSQNRDDWVRNTNAAGPTKELEGYNDNAARVQLLVAPSKDLSVLFNLHARDLKGSARVFRGNIIQRGSNDLVAGFDPAKVAYDGINDQKLSSSGGSVRVRWDFGGVALNAITGYETVDSFSRGDIDGTAGPYGPPTFAVPFNAESADGMPKHRQLTQEVRLESTGNSALRWIAGFYYFDERLNIDSFNYDSTAGNSQNGYAWQKQNAKSTALFGSVNLLVSDGVKLRGGLRYTRDSKDFTAQRLQSPIGAGATAVISRSPSANNLSGDFSATYALAKAVNAYARVSTGYRAPSIQGRLLFGDVVTEARAEKVTSYELGVKGDFFDRRARAAVSLFQYTIKDQQLTAVGGGANFNQLVNAAKTKGSGAEFDFKLLATESLLFSLGGSINKTRIKDPDLRVDACGNGCTVLDRITAPANPAAFKFAPTVAIDGNPLPQAPENTLNFSARYGMSVGGGELFVLTDWTYRSKINFFLYESVEFTGKPLTEGGLRVGYNFGNGKYEAAAFVRNIANQIRVVGGIDFNNYTGFINEPRTFGVSFKANF